MVIDDQIRKTFKDYPPVMPASQVKEALSIGEARLRQLVREGVLTPTRYVNKGPRFFLKGHVMAYVQETFTKEC